MFPFYEYALPSGTPPKRYFASKCFVFPRREHVVVANWGDHCGWFLRAFRHDVVDPDLDRPVAAYLLEWAKAGTWGKSLVYFEEPVDEVMLSKLTARGETWEWSPTPQRGIRDREERAFLQKYAPLVVKSVEG